MVQVENNDVVSATDPHALLLQLLQKPAPAVGLRAFSQPPLPSKAMVRRAGGLIAVALVSALTAQANRCDGPQVGCPPWWCPPKKPKHALYYNGISDIAPACFNLTEDDQRPHTVYIIGDWGGVLYGGVWAAPADHRSMQFKAHHRQFVNGVDNLAQQKVAKSMMQHAVPQKLGTGLTGDSILSRYHSTKREAPEAPVAAPVSPASLQSSSPTQRALAEQDQGQILYERKAEDGA
eukprot:s381_g3.t1